MDVHFYKAYITLRFSKKWEIAIFVSYSSKITYFPEHGYIFNKVVFPVYINLCTNALKDIRKPTKEIITYIKIIYNLEEKCQGEVFIENLFCKVLMAR